MNTWASMAEPVKQEKKPLRNQHKMGKCVAAGCANNRAVTIKGRILTYCREHNAARERDRYARRKVELLAAGVQSYSVSI